MKKSTSWKKRLLALALAATTVVSSFSFDWSSLKAEAASGGSLVMTTNQVQSGGKIAQVIQRDNTITSGTLQKLKSVSMMLHIGAGETVSVAVKFYQNANSISNYEEAPVVYGEKTYTNSSTNGEDKVITIFDGSTGVYLSENEALYAVATITTSGTSDALVEYGTDTTGGSGFVYVNSDYGWMSSADTMTFSWDDSYGTQNQSATSDSGVTGILTSLTGDSATKTSLNYALRTGASVDLAPTLSPAFDRVISYNSSKTAVATVSNGIITAVGTGSTDITITAGTFTKTIHVYVLDVSLSETSFSYSGYEQKPSVTVTGTVTENAGTASDVLTENTYYTVSYATDTVNVNNAVDISVTGLGVLSSFSYSDTYAIGTYNLNNATDKSTLNAYVEENLPFTIDMASDSVTTAADMPVTLADGKVHTLVYGTDYTVTSISRSTTGTKSVKYLLTLKGKGNYTGSVSVYQKVTATASAKIDISAIATLDVDTASFTYNGMEQTPNVEFFDRVVGTEISDFVADTDYQILYTEVGGTTAVEPTDAGDYTVTVVGIGAYTGSISADFSIDPLSIKNNASVVLAATNYIYTGSAIEPSVSSVKCTSLNRLLTKNTDYTISYSNNINTGTGTVTITGIGNYTGTYSTDFTIVGVFDDAKIYVDGTSSAYAIDVGGTCKKTYTYTGSAIEPVVKKVEIDSAALSTDDYTVSYSENINAGTGVITITGAGTYAGLNQSVSVYFTILPKSIENGKGILTINDISKTYNGSAQTLTAGSASGDGEYTLSVGSEYLVEGSDFDASYEDNTNAGEATLTVTAKGNYTGTLSAAFTINRLDISSNSSGVTTALTETSFSYTGSEITPEVVVALADGTVLSTDAGYEVYYANNKKVAAQSASLPPTVTVKGTGNLYGTVKLYFDITPSAGQTLSFTLEGLDYGTALTNQTTTLDGSASMAYTGSATYARITVKNGETALISGTDYTVSYANNVDVTTKDGDGNILKPTVTVTGIGNYANTVVNLTYSITRKDISNFVVEETDADSDGIPEFVVRASSTTTPLVESTDGGVTGDYTVTYDDNSTVGAKTASISGINNYDGTISVDYSVGEDIADALNGYKIQYTYAYMDGSGTAVGVQRTTAAISNGTDNIVTFDTLYLGLSGRPIIKLLKSDGTEVDSSYYKINFDSTARKVGNTVTATVNVTPNLSITTNPDAIYSSRTLTVKYTISAFDTSLLANNAKKMFLVPQDAAYVSTETATTSATYETAFYTYTGSEITPYKTMCFEPSAYNEVSSGLTVVAFDGGASGEETLTAGSDYTVTTTDGTTIGPEASTAVENLTIAMSNSNITGTHRRTAWINAADPANISIYSGSSTTDIRGNIEYDSTNLTYPNGYTKDYNGSEITPFGSDLSLYYGTGANKTKLALNSDYSVEYYDGSTATAIVTPSNVTSVTTKATPKNSGVWYVVITLSSNFGNSKIYGSFVINKKSLAGAKVYIWNTDTQTFASSAFTSYGYDATVKKPTPNTEGLNGFIVKDSDGITLNYGTDYTVEYSVADANYGDDFKLPGKYSVVITGTGTGNYASTGESASSYTSLSYKIVGDISNSTLFSFYEGVSASDAYTGEKNYTIDKNAQGVFTSEFDSSQMYLSVNDASANSLVKYQYNKGFIIYGLDNLTTPGEVTLTFAGDGDYYTGMRYFTVYAYGDIADAEVTGLNDTYTYTGSAINPTGVSLSYNGVALTKNTHYTTALSNNIDIGTAGYTITGMGYFTAGSGSVVKNFNIKYDLSKMTLSASDAQTYNYGNPVYLPDTTNIRYALKGADAKTWKLSDMAATAATPFKATYSNNTEAGTAEITLSVTDSDKAFGSTVFTYTIKPIQLDASTMTVTLSDASSTYTYTGEEIQPLISSVKIGTTVLQEDVDYYVTYANNINSALATDDTAPTILINGYGNYSGQVVKNFTIAPVDLATVGVINLTPADGNLPYSGGTAMLPTYEVAATVNSNTRTLTEGKDFTVTNSPMVTVPGDTGTITVAGMGNYAGSVSSATYTVTKCALSSASITKAVQEAEYTGNAITPSLTVTVTFADSTKTLTEGTDYDVSYGGASMINAGAYTITISAPASSAYYEGSTTTTFTINPKDLGTDGGMQVDGTVITISKTDDADDSVDDEYEVSAVDTQDWNNGNQVMPELIIHDVSNDNPEHSNTPNYKTLVKDQDYTIEWTNNRDAATNDPTNAAYDENGVPTITVKGKGNYKGTFTKTFTIGKDIADATKYESSLSEYSYIYNGTNQVPTVTVTNLTTNPTSTLTEGTDFSVVTPADALNAQESIDLVIQGESSFYGSITENYKIQKKTIDAASLVILPDSSLTKTYDDEGTVYSYFESDTSGYYYWATVYNGSAMKPTFNVYDTEISSTVPVSTDSYTVSYTNNTNAGGVKSPATAQIVLGGNYNTYSATPFKFVILPYQGGITLTLDANEMTYTGRNLTPGYTVTNASGQTLTEGMDYSITFSDNKNVGTATVAVTGMNNYINNDASQTFVIYANLTEDCVTITDQLYTGAEITPEVKVVCGGNTLVLGTDYQITASGSEDGYVSSGYVIVDSLQPTYYRNTPVTVTYNIVFGSDYLSVSGVANQYTYTGSAIKPAITVKDNNNNVLASTVTYSSNSDGTACVNVGTVTYKATVSVAGKSLVKTGTYKIVARNVNTCTFGSLSNDTYTGSSLKPPVSVTYLGESLKKGASGDYTITYSNNKNPGTAKVTVKGVNNYSGSRVMYFTISVGNVLNLKAKGVSNKKLKLTWTKVNHASGYVITYKIGSKTYTKTTTKNSYTISGLKQSKNYKISVKAYKTISSKKYYGTSSSVTGKTLVETPEITLSSTTAKKIKISWKKNTSATGYTVYRSTKKNSGFVKVADVPSKKSSWTNKKLTSNKKYYYYIRAYQLVNGKKVYGAKSAVKSIKAK